MISWFDWNKLVIKYVSIHLVWWINLVIVIGHNVQTRWLSIRLVPEFEFKLFNNFPSSEGGCIFVVVLCTVHWCVFVCLFSRACWYKSSSVCCVSCRYVNTYEESASYSAWLGNIFSFNVAITHKCLGFMFSIGHRILNRLNSLVPQ